MDKTPIFLAQQARIEFFGTSPNVEKCIYFRQERALQIKLKDKDTQVFYGVQYLEEVQQIYADVSGGELNIRYS